MEVHKHPHHITHQKKWTEYLLEFFMLFLAVFLGFVAENIREHGVERSREHEYVKSLIKDFENDTLQFGKTVKRLRSKISYYDSVLLFLKNPGGYNNSLPYKFWSKTSVEQFYAPTEPTLAQLKSSGNLRLIHKRAALDSILNYDSRINGSYRNQTQYEVEFSKNLIVGIEKCFDMTGLNSSLNDEISHQPAMESNYDLRLTSPNKDVIQEVYNLHITAKGADFFYIGAIEKAKSVATNLIKYLRQEYEMVNE